MNAAQLHLLLNHLPVLLPIVGAGLIAIGLALKSSEIREAGVWLLIFSALAAIPVYLSGEPTQNILKNYPGTSRLLIEDHESSALPALILLEVTGVVSLLFAYQLRIKKNAINKTWMWGLLILLSVISFSLVARTAHLGGLIRHEEIRNSDRF